MPIDPWKPRRMPRERESNSRKSPVFTACVRNVRECVARSQASTRLLLFLINVTTLHYFSPHRDQSTPMRGRRRRSRALRRLGLGLVVLVLLCFIALGYTIRATEQEEQNDPDSEDYDYLPRGDIIRPEHFDFNLAIQRPWPENAQALLNSSFPSWEWGPPKLWGELLDAPSPLTFSLPPLATSSDHIEDAGAGAAFLALHVFSTPSAKSRQRRDLIRSLSPMDTIPEGYKHLIDFKFILGYPDPTQHQTPEVMEEERIIRDEMAKHGDIIRLKGLKNGDNMNNGKTLQWLQWVGNEGRPAHWVFKCDDDVSGSVILWNT